MTKQGSKPVSEEQDAGASGKRLGIRRELDAARAANLAKERYLVTIGHEVRAPLNSIYGYAQLLEKDILPDTVEAGRVIRRSVEHLATLIEGILDISQVESGILKIKKDAVDLPVFVEQTVEMFQQEAASKGLRLIVNATGEPPNSVRVDQSRLRQILINLLSNAIKFTSSGTVTLRWGYSHQIGTFEVIDTGPGIAPQDQERIFAPFERVSNLLPGRGLGLAISQALARILGGELDFHDAPEGGSVFRLRLMLPAIPAPPSAARCAVTIVGYEGYRRSILVIDDDPDQSAPLRTLLTALGFDVRVAASGEEGLDAASGMRFDLALIDVMMPGMSGWETARALAVVDPSAAIIMLSADGLAKETVDGTGAPTGVLAKPVGHDELLQTIGDRLGLSWTVARSAVPDDAAEGAGRETLGPKAAKHVAALRELLDIGHVRGIEAEIRALEIAVPEARRLVRRLYACLDGFDFTAMRQALDTVS